MKPKSNVKLMLSHNSKLSFISTGFVPFLSKKFKAFSRTFKDTVISHFSRTPFSAKKSLESTSFFVFPQHEQFHPEGLSVLAPFSLEFHIHYKVSIEIQGLSSSDCNFQGLSRPQIFILKFKEFQGLLWCM